MKRRLTLRSEHLTALTEDELRLAAGAAQGERFSDGPVGCIVSLNPCLTLVQCSKLCNIS